MGLEMEKTQYLLLALLTATENMEAFCTGFLTFNIVTYWVSLVVLHM
jgi:hypothetical protein